MYLPYSRCVSWWARARTPLRSRLRLTRRPRPLPSPRGIRAPQEAGSATSWNEQPGTTREDMERFAECFCGFRRQIRRGRPKGIFNRYGHELVVSRISFDFLERTILLE